MKRKKNPVAQLDAFLKIACDELDLKSLPKISFVEHTGQASFGSFNPATKEIVIALAERHLIDVFRTLAHELVHYQQLINHAQLDGSDGSAIENEANARAGVIMRRFAKSNPILFEEQVDEDLSVGYADWGWISPLGFVYSSNKLACQKFYTRDVFTHRQLLNVVAKLDQQTAHALGWVRWQVELELDSHTLALNFEKDSINPDKLIQAVKEIGQIDVVDSVNCDFMDKFPNSVDYKDFGSVSQFCKNFKKFLEKLG